MKIKTILLLLGVIFIISSCSTTEKFSVYVPAGTKVYTPYESLVPGDVVKKQDRTEITVPSDMYCGYIFVQPEGFNTRIPVGLDYKTNRHIGTKTAVSLGYTLASAGIGGMLGSTIAIIGAAKNEDEDNESLFAKVCGISGGVALVGLGIGMPADGRMKQTAYDYNFSYDGKQRIVIPNLSKTLLHPDPPKGYDEKADVGKSKGLGRKKASSGKESVQETSVGTKVSASRSDHGKKIEGTYKGSGTLLSGKNVEDKYSEIDVVIERIDKTHVSVRIIESDEDYFDSPLIYTINKNKNGSYTLGIDKLPDAAITISKSGKLTFKHEKVNIDNNVFTLSIDAVKD